jgi:hypothetical protein
MKCEARLKKMANKGEEVEYRCLVRATDGKKNISTAVLSLPSCVADNNTMSCVLY